MIKSHVAGSASLSKQPNEYCLQYSFYQTAYGLVIEHKGASPLLVLAYERCALVERFIIEMQSSRFGKNLSGQSTMRKQKKSIWNKLVHLQGFEPYVTQ